MERREWEPLPQFHPLPIPWERYRKPGFPCDKCGDGIFVPRYVAERSRLALADPTSFVRLVEEYERLDWTCATCGYRILQTQPRGIPDGTP